eukprot:CAMPEP_0116142842 /NCGR_PEP_ID=MMETSP0329-20121206/15123_1 /TAXON_ID=697910 /ORGANISM="Pseudo-nitzschia arenysensis, Strain B593" /LENGTH=231 /DNA_ID=CAMNT_0003638103 /DNA_START=99 /DNA_END=792 /DNA_ORIENTATION=-
MSSTMSMNSLLIEDRSKVDEDSNNNMNSGIRGSVRRRMEDVDYWMKQAGWYDDDEAMVAYNNGVYNTNYVGDGSSSSSSNGSSSSYSNRSSSSSSSSSSSGSQELPFGLKIAAAVLSIVAAVVVFRVLSRRSGKKKSSSSSKSRSSDKSRRSLSALDLRVAAVRWDAHAVDHARDAADHEPAAADSPAPTMSSWKNPNRGDPEEAEVDLADRDPRVDPSLEPNGNRRPRFW